ncbi:glycerol-3-phosphate responsive antiterminator [Gorillibacterium massiliense]|uniref:glycerol-3-phosphate responsive antiterminator n=1 Tax=Gorillibacterium massiliense TaxID=1280390 RepID=UPI000593FC63|nr:glycerol-3-phosphate responsive antiterminator [Gorillibacterium massiliense]
MDKLQTLLGGKRVIPSVLKAEDIKTACKSGLPVIFLLSGDLFTIGDYVTEMIRAGKMVFIHIDFIAGFGNDSIIVKYVAERIKPTGIISTKGHLIKQAKKCGLTAIQRMFLIDSAALEHGLSTIRQNQPDAIEVMPGLIPRVIRELHQELDIPIIAGGLVKYPEEIELALNAGAMAVSTGDKSLWM